MSKIGVRFDKVTQISIDLKEEELENIMEERLKYYSSGKITSLESIIDIKTSLIYELADSSPRNMFRLLYTIYNLQEDLDMGNINKFIGWSSGSIIYRVTLELDVGPWANLQVILL